MLNGEFVLSQPIAITLFVIAIISGHQYRKVWKTEGPAWKAWATGLTAATCLIAVALIPVV